MAYEVPDLPYAYDALEPHIDEATMRVHHDKHHQAYVDKVNAALEDTEWEDKPIEEVLRNLDKLDEGKRKVVRNNGGGHANHAFFWRILSPHGGGAPSGRLFDAIDDGWESFDAFKSEVRETGIAQFGSGWVWVVKDGDDSVSITSTPNQDTPLMEGRRPILGIDVWEHAYYLKYQNKRPDYIDAIWNVIDWGEVQRRFEAE